MGPSRANPLTGEIIDADIIFDASMVRYWKQDRQLLRTAQRPRDRAGQPDPGGPARAGPVAADHAGRSGRASWNDRRRATRTPPSARPAQGRPRHGRLPVRARTCRHELGLAAMALARAARTAQGRASKLPEELIGQAIKEMVMHEVGHTLGLRHNFKASTMLKTEQLHDTAITRKRAWSAA